MNLTQAILVAAATELNEVLGLDPTINLTLSRTELRNKVREAAELVEPSDTLGKDTQAVVDQFKEEKEPATARTTKGNGKDKDGKDKKTDAATGTAKKKAAAEKKDEKKPSAKRDYTRAHSLKEALAKGGTRQELIQKSDKLYAEHGGKANENGSKATVDILVPPLMIFNVIEKDGDVYRLKS